MRTLTLYFLISTNDIKYVEDTPAIPKPFSFKYDFKSGDYFPKLYKEIYTYLFSTILDTTSALRTSP